MSPRACLTKGFTIERLDHFNLQTGQWCEALVEDRTAGPAQIAETRIDFAGWLRTLSNRDRELAETLARGETTGCVARSSGFRRHGSASCVSDSARAGTGSWASWRRSVATA